MELPDRKVFVVGVPRSGTTLVQSILAAHPQVYATRETHLMAKLRRSHPRWRALDYLWLHPDRRRDALDYLADRCPDLYRQYTAARPPCRTLGEAARLLDRLFSAVAHTQGKRAWVEKSPEHVGYVRLLEKEVPGAIFVHTIRDPRDNIASLYDAGQKYASSWRGRQTLEQCIRTYRNYLEKSTECLERDPVLHRFVVYERIIEQPRVQMEALYAHVRLPSEAPDPAAINSGSTTLTGDNEPWKKEQGPGIQDTRLVKYHRLFDATQQQMIEEQTSALHRQVIDRIPPLA